MLKSTVFDLDINGTGVTPEWHSCEGSEYARIAFSTQDAFTTCVLTLYVSLQSSGSAFFPHPALLTYSGTAYKNRASELIDVRGFHRIGLAVTTAQGADGRVRVFVTSGGAP